MTTEPFSDEEALDQQLSRAQALLRQIHSAAPDAGAQLQELGAMFEALAMELQTTRAVRQSNGELMKTFRFELLNPMTAVKGYIDLLLTHLSDNLNDKQTQLLRSAQRHVEREIDLVRKFTDIILLREGYIHLMVREVSFQEVMADVEANLAERIQERAHALTTYVTDNLPPVLADYGRLVQVMSNLVSNACQYAPDGSTVSVYAAEIEEGVRITIMDTGVGMSKEQLGRLGEPFYRGYHPSVEAQPGAGLGFHVARQLVRMMGGDIAVTSELDVGTIVSFILPTAPQQGAGHGPSAM